MYSIFNLKEYFNKKIENYVIIYQLILMLLIL